MEISAQLGSPSMNARDKNGLAKRISIKMFLNSHLQAQAPQLGVGGDLQCHCHLFHGGDSLKADAPWHFSTKSKKE